MSPDALKARSHEHAQDDYFDAEAIAESLMVELSEYGSRFLTWGEGSRKVLADLQRRSDQAEARRVQARRRMLYTFCELLQAAHHP